MQSRLEGVALVVREQQCLSAKHACSAPRYTRKFHAALLLVHGSICLQRKCWICRMRIRKSWHVHVRKDSATKPQMVPFSVFERNISCGMCIKRSQGCMALNHFAADFCHLTKRGEGPGSRFQRRLTVSFSFTLFLARSLRRSISVSRLAAPTPTFPTRTRSDYSMSS
eukprot:48926-Rhodomonas_salina.2